PEEGGDVRPGAGVEEPASGPGYQRPQPDVDEASDVGLQLWPVTHVSDHLDRRGPELVKRRNLGRDHRAGPARTTDRIPAAGLVHPLQALRHDLRERLLRGGRRT